jgi:outer membrane lipoprotein-sorting protein
MIQRALIFLFLISGPLAISAQTADEIIAKSFEAIGGADKWRAIKTTKSEAKMAMMGFEFGGTMFGAMPNKMRVEVDVMGQKIIQGYDGSTAWWINPLQIGPDAQVMPDDMAEQMKNQEFQSPLLDYATKGHTVSLEGQETVEGAACYKIKLTKKDGSQEFHFFDAENYVPVLVRAPIKTGPTAGQFSETFMSDYQEVNGLMFAFFLETKVAGQSVQKITLSKVVLDEEMKDDLFLFPKK